MENSKKFHFLGVGGVSMSALARFLVQKGHTVSGVDLKKNLRIRGVCTRKKQALQNLKNADFVVVSNAIKDTDK
ncbi:MAG: UDP-N-acetylmuramate--L-alanine ligase, partial [Clostridia bacterium]|nr:UDP-N-acetylmuramate--L-alanine ligase [Clostridia bacterium]